ncbi:WxL protein peptidoglycan domain-containing protein [Microbacterium invictum]|uniref:DUF916 domain-containing protein n=1 Tax=Microbacterium invictum TaxID=515415 RepID=A0AA40VNF3_9MICO|nr:MULTISPECIES: DUF916 domain-containing protein [Microbacterium]MBB4141314.1 hypothetical protein [Microbacterium invictum]
MHSFRSRIAGGAAIVLLTVVAAAGVAAPGWAASDDVTWGVRAADNDHGTERQNFTYVVDPGESVDDTIEVTNHGADDLALELYAADGFTTSSGQLDVLTPGEASTEIGAWTTVETSSLLLEPGESAAVPFQLAVPENASPGDYAGAIVSSLQTSQDSGLSVDRRLGIRIHLQVGGELAPALEIADFTVEYDAAMWPFVTNPATAEVTVHNSGNARLAAGQTVTLSGLFWSSTSEPTQVPQLLPGETWTTSIEVTGIIPSVYLTAAGELVPTRPDGEVEDAVAASVGVWAVPWLLFGMIALAALIAVALTWAAKRRRRHAKQAEQQRISDAVDAALKERDSATT